MPHLRSALSECVAFSFWWCGVGREAPHYLLPHIRLHNKTRFSSNLGAKMPKSRGWQVNCLQVFETY
jgi:hypothetical protein